MESFNVSMLIDNHVIPHPSTTLSPMTSVPATHDRSALPHLQLSLHLNIDCFHLIQLLTQGDNGGLLLEDILLKQTEGRLDGEWMGRGGETWEAEEGLRAIALHFTPRAT